MSERIEHLYRDLTDAFPHPFDWMHLLHKPPFWWRRHRKAHKQVGAIFAQHGFTLTDRVAEDYHRIFPEDWQHYGEDAGGKVTRKLARALHVVTPEQSREITACTRLIAVGYTAQALRDMNYAEAAIRAAMEVNT